MAHGQNTGEGVSKPARASSWPAVRYLGWGFFWCWVNVTFWSTSIFDPSDIAVGRPALSWSVSGAALAVALLILGLSSTRLSSERSQRFLLVAAPALSAVGTVLIALRSGPGTADTLAFFGGSVLTGIGSAGIIVSWGRFFGSIETRRMLVYVPGSFVLNVVLYGFVTALQPAVSVIVTAMLPIASMLALAQCRRESTINARSDDTSDERVFPLTWKFLVALCVLNGIVGLGAALISSTDAALFGLATALSTIAGGTVAFGFAVAAIAVSRDLDLGLVFRPALPLLVAACTLLPLSSSSARLAAGGLLQAGWMSLELLLFLTLSSLVYRRGLSAFRLFGIANAAVHGSIAAGAAMGLWMSGHPWVAGDTRVAVSIILVNVLVGTGLLLTDLYSASGLATTTPSDYPEALLPRRCTELGMHYSLSPREQEILLLLARGRSLPYVQNELRISASTASTHTRNLYKKLNVHTRQELLDIIESSSAPGDPRA